MEALNTMDVAAQISLFRDIVKKNPGNCVRTFDWVMTSGACSESQFLVDFLWYLENASVLMSEGKVNDESAFTDEQIEETRQIVSETDEERMTELIELFGRVNRDLRYVSIPRIAIEVALIEACMPGKREQYEMIERKTKELAIKLSLLEEGRM